MFERLSESLGTAFRNLSGRGRISESNVREAMEEVRTALLEADVNLDVVDRFCADCMADAVGREVTKSLKPGEEMVGIVHRRLVDLMGPVDSRISLVEPGPTVVMLCGLQGSGKTTTCGKLAAWFKKRGQSVMVCAADLQRPAAVEQLQVVIGSVAADASGPGRVAFYGEPERCAEYGKAVGVAVGVCQRALAAARQGKFDVLVLDTAGRLHVNDELMQELEAVDRALQPHAILLVVDAMTGQDAVQSARAFHSRMNVDGIVLSKFDSDTRGGAALSVKTVTGAPIKFVGTGERFEALEEFHPERVAGRILGMGDVVSLVERAQAEVSEADAEEAAAKMAKGQFTLDDFLKQMRMIRRMGPMKQLLGMLPGVGSMLNGIDIEEKQVDRMEAIILSMTRREREKVSIIDRSRQKRIAAGSGAKVEDVSRMVKQFEMMQKMTQHMAGMGTLGKAKAMKELARAAPGGMGIPGFLGRGSTATESPKSRFKQRKKR
ncbi:MAG: signal recognition particle protein [Planctomycetota bacterium]